MDATCEGVGKMSVSDFGMFIIYLFSVAVEDCHGRGFLGSTAYKYELCVCMNALLFFLLLFRD